MNDELRPVCRPVCERRFMVAVAGAGTRFVRRPTTPVPVAGAGDRNAVPVTGTRFCESVKCEKGCQERQEPRTMAGAGLLGYCARRDRSGDRCHVLGLRALRALRDVELDGLV